MTEECFDSNQWLGDAPRSYGFDEDAGVRVLCDFNAAIDSFRKKNESDIVHFGIESPTGDLMLYVENGIDTRQITTYVIRGLQADKNGDYIVDDDVIQFISPRIEADPFKID